MNECNYATDWVNVDATKRIAENWKDSEWVPSSVVFVPANHAYDDMFVVQRTKAITPNGFKQHKHE